MTYILFFKLVKKTKNKMLFLRLKSVPFVLYIYLYTRKCGEAFTWSELNASV